MVAARRKPSAVLIVNPSAGRLSDAQRHDAIREIDSIFRVELYETSERGSAIDLARDAAAHGVPLVIAFGGDGHVNEVVNGIAGTVSALGIIPGGTMNVFARALGIPLDPLEAAHHLQGCLTGRPRLVHLGKMEDRYFTFSAGCGFDAEAAGLVEDHLAHKRRFGQLYFYWSALRVLAGSYRHRNPSMVLHGPFGEVDVSMAIASNTGPYAYLLDRPVRVAPEVHLEKGLDVFALRRMRIEALPLYAFRAAALGDVSRHRDAFYASDLEGFEVTSTEPFARHVDGEPLEAATSASFSLARDVLKVRA